MPAWRRSTLFGSTNHCCYPGAGDLRGALKHRRIAFGFALVPALLMAVMPLMALCMMVVEHGPFSMLGGIALAMVLLGLYVSMMSLRFVSRRLSLGSRLRRWSCMDGVLQLQMRGKESGGRRLKTEWDKRAAGAQE